MPTTLFQMPPRNMDAGDTGSQQANLPDGATQIVATVNKVNWDYTGGPAMTLVIEDSLDGGATWQTAMVAGWDDEPTNETTPNVASQQCSPRPGTGRRGRLSWTFHKAVRISGSLVSNP